MTLSLQQALPRLAWLLPVLLACGSGCGGPGGGEADLPASYVPVTLDKDDPERLLRYYFGGYAASEGADPFRTGLLLDRDGRFYVNLDSLESRFPGAASALIDADASHGFEWEEVEAFIEQTYASARRLPPTLADLRAEAPYEPASGDWFVVETDGVMTTARRRLFVPVAALREALSRYGASGDRLLYPAGTTIVGEHYLGGARVETTVMRRRADGFWDFIVYDGADQLADSTTTPPRALRSPVQCVGCHFGSRLFEPERSFPARAEPGPHGPRQVYVDDALRNAAVVRRFDEHRKRSDSILGLYNTLFVARLVADREAGRLSPEDAALLQSLGL